MGNVDCVQVPKALLMLLVAVGLVVVRMLMTVTCAAAWHRAVHCSEEEIHARHEQKREYCERCPMIIKMIEDEEKLRVRLLEMEKEKLRLLYEAQNWAAISRIEQGAFYHFLTAERNDDRCDQTPRPLPHPAPVVARSICCFVAMT